MSVCLVVCLLLQYVLRGLSESRVLIWGLSSKAQKKKTARKKEAKTTDEDNRGQKNSGEDEGGKVNTDSKRKEKCTTPEQKGTDREKTYLLRWKNEGNTWKTKHWQGPEDCLPPMTFAGFVTVVQSHSQIVGWNLIGTFWSVLDDARCATICRAFTLLGLAFEGCGLKN